MILRQLISVARPAGGEGPDAFIRHWDLSGALLDEPNQRRGGWSRAERVDDYRPEGGVRGLRVCLKKAYNHKRYSLAHPLGLLTYANEVAMIEAFRRAGIRVPEVAFFAARGRRCVLATVFLEGFTPLTAFLARWRGRPRETRLQRRAIIGRLAATVRRMHRARLMHNNLYPKHIFLRDSDLEPCLIDLELSRRCWLSRSCRARDLDVLNRHTSDVSRTDKLRFLLEYTGEQRVSPAFRRLWNVLSGRMRMRRIGELRL